MSTTESTSNAGRRALFGATLAILVGYAVAGFTLVTVTTALRPGSDAAAGVIFLGEGLAGLLALVAMTLAVIVMVVRSRAHAPFAVRSILVLLAALGLIVVAPLLCVGYLVASTPFV